MSTTDIGKMTVRELLVKTCEKYVFEPNDENTVQKIKNECVNQLNGFLDELEFHIDDSTINIVKTN